MVVIMIIVAMIGSVASEYDFPTLYFYISLSHELAEAVKHYMNDKTAKR